MDVMVIDLRGYTLDGWMHDLDTIALPDCVDTFTRGAQEECAGKGRAISVAIEALIQLAERERREHERAVLRLMYEAETIGLMLDLVAGRRTCPFHDGARCTDIFTCVDGKMREFNEHHDDPDIMASALKRIAERRAVARLKVS